MKDRADLAAVVAPLLGDGDLVLTMGAGDLTTLPDELGARGRVRPALDALADRLGGARSTRRAARRAHDLPRRRHAPRCSSRRAPTRTSSASPRRSRAREVPVLVVGRGSNLLVADEGFDGLAIVLVGRVRGDRRAHRGPTTGRLGARRRRGRAARSSRGAAADQGLAGLEWAVGVPGSVGGAVRMNAGGHGDDDRRRRCAPPRSSTCATGRATVRPRRSLGLGYRHSDLSRARGRHRRDVHRRARRRRRGPRAASPRSCAGVASTSPAGPTAARCSRTRPTTTPRGSSRRPAPRGAGTAPRRSRTSTRTSSRPTATGSADDVAALIGEVRDLVEADSGVALSHRGRLRRLRGGAGEPGARAARAARARPPARTAGPASRATARAGALACRHRVVTLVVLVGLVRRRLRRPALEAARRLDGERHRRAPRDRAPGARGAAGLAGRAADALGRPGGRRRSHRARLPVGRVGHASRSSWPHTVRSRHRAHARSPW